MRPIMISSLLANTFSLNIWTDLQSMWQFGFMRNAFEAGTIIAVVAGVVGYFVVIRRLSFAAHALSHAGFAGAAGAVLIGVNPLIGLMAFTSAGGLVMGALGRRAAARDAQVGIVLAFMLGLGVLFISLYKGYATEAYSLLFGEILGISTADVWVSLIIGVIVLALMALIYRPLLFSSLDEDVAEAKGVPVLGLGFVFMIIIAVTTSIAVQVVGVLLIFALMVTPVALIATWFGLFIAYYQPYPVSFFITAFVFVIYLLTRFVRVFQHRRSHVTTIVEVLDEA
jgi:zinc/manganese transport system permease protein